MAIRQVFVAPGQTVPLSAVSVGYFASFVGTGYSAQLQCNIDTTGASHEGPTRCRSPHADRDD